MHTRILKISDIPGSNKPNKYDQNSDLSKKLSGPAAEFAWNYLHYRDDKDCIYIPNNADSLSRCIVVLEHYRTANYSEETRKYAFKRLAECHPTWAMVIDNYEQLKNYFLQEFDADFITAEMQKMQKQYLTKAAKPETKAQTSVTVIPSVKEKKPQFPPIDQTSLMEKIQCFLKAQGETLPDWALEGMCNGYNIMTMRSNLIDEFEKYLSRLRTLSSATADELVIIANLILKFKKKYKKAVAAHQHQLLQDLKQCRGKAQKIKVRNEFCKQAEEQAKANFNDKEKELLAFGQELYTFILSLLFAQDPKKTGLSIEVKKEENITEQRINQQHVLDILRVIPPDAFFQPVKTKEKSQTLELKLPIEKVFHFNLNLTEEELAYLLEQTIFNNDSVRITDFKHTLYFMKKNNIFILCDANFEEKPEQIITCLKLANLIKKCFLNTFNVKTDFFGIDMTVYAQIDRPIPRPSISTVLDTIFKKRLDTRGKTEINILSHLGVTSLEFAIIEGNEEMATELLRRKADARSGIYESWKVTFPPLIRAIHEPNLNQFIDRLLHNNANINVLYKGKTALHIAARKNKVEIVRILLRHNADITIKDSKNQTALDIAKTRNHLAIVKLLKSHKKNQFKSVILFQPVGQKKKDREFDKEPEHKQPHPKKAKLTHN